MQALDPRRLPLILPLMLLVVGLGRIHAAEPVVLNVWPGTPPGETAKLPPEADQTKPTDKLIAGERIIKLGNVSTPQIAVYRPDPAKANGAAVVICPGGGHHILAYDLEGTEVATWLNTLGVTGIVLKYRVPFRDKDRRWLAAVQDAQRAMSLVRSQADEWNIDPQRIGICGFSAGGETAALTALLGTQRQYESIDDVDKVSSRPDFAMLIYSGGLVEKGQSRLKDDVKVTKDAPPMFFVHAFDDGVSVHNSLLLAAALKDVGVPAELHVYATGGHGYGLRKTTEPVTNWPKHAAKWMRRMQFLEAADHQSQFFQKDVFISGQEGYHTFRIPALTVTTKGTILAFCEGRKSSREDLGNNDLMLKRSTDGGRTWGPLQLIHEQGDDTIGNPTVVVDQVTSTIWLCMMHDVSTVLITQSADDGQSWSKPVDVTRHVKNSEWGFYAVGPGVGIQLRHGPHKGRLVIPAYHRATKDKSGPSAAHVFYSDDHGQTWNLGGSAGLHTNECQVVETLQNGQSVLLLNMRNHLARSGGQPERSGVRLVSRSLDGGLTWSEPQPDQTLIEPTCQASILRWSWPDEGTSRILFSNPASNGRRNLTVRLSEDEGRTWPVSRSVHSGSSAYSCLAALPSGRIGLIYERDDYGQIPFASFTEDWLRKSDP